MTPPKITRACDQCGLSFEPKSSNHRFDTPQCRWDYTNGRAKDISRARQETGVGWPVVQPVTPVTVKVSAAKHRPTHLGNDWQTAVILPDVQFGYRRLLDGTLDPFHDDAALDIAEQIVAFEQPQVVAWLGDLLDLPEMSKYRQEPQFASTLQPALDRAYHHLAVVSALSGRGVLLEGNHDARLELYVIDNAKAAFGLKPARSAPDDWPVLSVPSLLRLEELGIKYVTGYPANVTYLNDNLALMHGTKIGSGGRTGASMVVEDERVSVINGHTHRIETAYRTRATRNSPKFSVAHSPGCLCRIDGAVPSANNRGSGRNGQPRLHWENWQQGLAVVRFEPGDGRFHIESVPIFNGWAIHRGVEFHARTGVNRAAA